MKNRHIILGAMCFFLSAHAMVPGPVPRQIPQHLYRFAVVNLNQNPVAVEIEFINPAGVKRKASLTIPGKARNISHFRDQRTTDQRHATVIAVKICEIHDSTRQFHKTFRPPNPINMDLFAIGLINDEIKQIDYDIASLNH